MRNALLVALNTLRVTFRARSKLLVYFVMPVLGVVLSLFLNFGAPGGAVRIGVVDADGGRLAVDLVATISAWGRYAPTAVGEGELRSLLAKGSVEGGLVIPAGWTDSVLAGRPLPVRMASIKGGEVTGWLSEIVQAYTASVSRMVAASAGDSGKLATMLAAAQAGGAALTVENLPDLSSGKRITLSSLGFLVYFLMLGAGITMQLVLAERRNRTYLRIRTAPVRAIQYITGNGVAGFAIVLAQIVAVLLILKLVIRVDTFVPDLLLFLILFLFGLVAVAVAMAITAFSRSTQVATILINLIITPTSMIAGCFWPASLMPQFLQRAALFLPQRWALDAVQKAQTAAAAGAIGADLLVIAAFAIALFLLAGYRYARFEEAGRFV